MTDNSERGSRAAKSYVTNKVHDVTWLSPGKVSGACEEWVYLLPGIWKALVLAPSYSCCRFLSHSHFLFCSSIRSHLIHTTISPPPLLTFALSWDSCIQLFLIPHSLELLIESLLWWNYDFDVQSHCRKFRISSRSYSFRRDACTHDIHHQDSTPTITTIIIIHNYLRSFRHFWTCSIAHHMRSR